MIFPTDKDPTQQMGRVTCLRLLKTGHKGVGGSACLSAPGHTDPRAAELPSFAGAVPFSVNRFIAFSESDGCTAMNSVNPRDIFEFLH